jgi:hypothetical protein
MAVTSLAAPVLLEYLAKNSKLKRKRWLLGSKARWKSEYYLGQNLWGTGVDRLTIIQTTDGGYLIGAHQTLIFQPKRPIIHAEILIWIIKIDQSGNIMWQKNIWRQQFWLGTISNRNTWWWIHLSWFISFEYLGEKVKFKRTGDFGF